MFPSKFTSNIFSGPTVPIMVINVLNDSDVALIMR
jgi:hypothetical protein